MNILPFIDGLAWAMVIVFWPLFVLTLWLQWKEDTFAYPELRDYYRGYSLEYPWKRYLVLAVIGSVWLISM